LALGLAVLPATATAGGAANDALGATGANKAAVATATAPNAPVAVATKESPAKPAESSMESQLQQLRDLLEAQSKQLQSQSQQLLEQQQKMLELETALHSAAPNAAVASASAASAAVQPAQGGQAAPDWKKPFDALEKKLGAMGPFSFSGDFRLRDEPFFGGPTDKSQVRNRERFRARFYLNAKLNDDISGGLAVASGDLNDPISTNQTINQFYTRKPFNLDRAFINYTPHQFKPLTLTGGRFAYPWYRTELTWDNDLNPEGLAQKLEWKSDKWTLLRQFALVGFELPFAEVAGTASTNKSIHQSVVYGGQIQTKWQLWDWLSVTLDSAFYNYHNPDAIALALAQASSKNPQSPTVGLLPLGGSSVQNSITTITKATVVTADVDGEPTALPTGVSTITSAQFRSKFALSDTIAQFDIKTPSAAWPIRLLADYVQNTKACSNIPNIPTVAPPNTSTATYTLTTSVACDAHHRRGHWLEARFGRQAEKGDWQFSYTHMLIEREAVMSAFNFSDLRQNSEVLQNRVEAFYNWQKNVQFGFTGLFGRPLASTQPYLKRLQFDVAYKF
jgi:hypothetical protein